MTTCLDIELVCRACVSAGAPLGSTTNEPEIDEAAQGLGNRVLADSEVRSQRAHVGLDRSVAAALGAESQLLEYHPGKRANAVTGTA